MSRRQVIDQMLQMMNQLPDEKLNEVADFTSFVLKRHEESLLQQGIEHLVETSDTFVFLNDEEDLYSRDDLKERFK
ncbi:hypothetical protein GCM10023187_40520 [Nibrella viscosa]|uniref:DUF2281 domain-containing protein n=1 Tax=Nibrella viscosa TaxID=1084524 RepID=A0ABP8KRR3_9BACT